MSQTVLQLSDFNKKPEKQFLAADKRGRTQIKQKYQNKSAFSASIRS
jgi:hypothetical protein